MERAEAASGGRHHQVKEINCSRRNRTDSRSISISNPFITCTSTSNKSHHSEASELAFVDLVFSKHTKKACAWAHRRWCLARLWGTAEQDEDSSSTVDAQEAHELGLTASIAERFPKNYYAWTHRWWVVKAGAKRRRIGSRAGPWLETQAAVGVEWVERHAWDFSAASFLLQALAAWAEEHDDSEAVEKRLRGMLEAGARQQDQCPGHESLWYKRRGLLALWMDQQQQRQQQWRRPAAAMMLLPPVLREEGGVARYPTSSSSTWKGVGACLGWELEMAVYYQAGQGPFYTEASGGLLWEAAARRRQRRCAWAHARWVLELVQRSCQTGQGSAAGMEGWARRLAEGLEVVRREAGLVPPGYGKLVRQLVAADFGEGRCE